MNNPRPTTGNGPMTPANDRRKSPEIQESNSPEIIKGPRIISYNLREDERPDGLKVRFKIRIETGRKAAALNAQQAEAIRELLQWASQHPAPPSN
jgi:hypothetical protein